MVLTLQITEERRYKQKKEYRCGVRDCVCVCEWDSVSDMFWTHAKLVMMCTSPAMPRVMQTRTERGNINPIRPTKNQPFCWPLFWKSRFCIGRMLETLCFMARVWTFAVWPLKCCFDQGDTSPMYDCQPQGCYSTSTCSSALLLGARRALTKEFYHWGNALLAIKRRGPYYFFRIHLSCFLPRVYFASLRLWLKQI